MTSFSIPDRLDASIGPTRPAAVGLADMRLDRSDGAVQMVSRHAVFSQVTVP